MMTPAALKERVATEGFIKPTLIITQGPPGSGKSYLCQEIQSLAEHEVKIFSTDDYFMDEDGEYFFDFECLGEYHLDNQERARQAMDDNELVIMIANTNSMAWEAHPYVRDGVARGYDIWFVRCDGAFQNVHDVPPHKVVEIRNRMQYLSVEVCM